MSGSGVAVGSSVTAIVAVGVGVGASVGASVGSGVGASDGEPVGSGEFTVSLAHAARDRIRKIANMTVIAVCRK